MMIYDDDDDDDDNYNDDQGRINLSRVTTECVHCFGGAATSFLTVKTDDQFQSSLFQYTFATPQ